MDHAHGLTKKSWALPENKNTAIVRKGSRLITKKEISGSFILLVVAVVTSLGMNHFSRSGIALRGQWDKSKGVVTAHSKQEILHEEINNPLRVRQMVENKEIVLIDVRPEDLYDMGHLPGALSFPVIEFDQNLDRLLELVPKDQAIVVYCSGVECSDSHRFASMLKASQYKRVQVYSGGFSEWQEMGFEIEK